ncbi:MAG: tripartite tricarboxylate transporter substrate-binding protein [Xanthobacteraceae bacterium]
MLAHRRHFIIAGFLSLLATMAGLVAPVRADDYPAHPVRIITDSAPGSSIDVPTRIIAEALSRLWGQQAVVINQPGAGGAIAVRSVTAAPADGYTLGVAGVSAFVALPGTADNLPIQVPRDVTPVGYIGGAPMFITAAPWLSIKTLPELIALAKQKPGELSFGVNGIGRLTHLTGELLQSRAGIKLLMVPYSGGTAQILTDMMGKRIALVFDAYSGINGAVEAKNAVPLAVASAERLAVSPELPTVAETLPGFEAVGWQALVAPAGTPDVIVAKLNADLIKAMRDPDAKKRLGDLGRDDRPMSPRETLAFIQGEQAKWAPIVQQIAGSH